MRKAAEDAKRSSRFTALGLRGLGHAAAHWALPWPFNWMAYPTIHHLAHAMAPGAEYGARFVTSPLYGLAATNAAQQASSALGAGDEEE
jgi:hypothetical protein